MIFGGQVGQMRSIKIGTSQNVKANRNIYSSFQGGFLLKNLLLKDLLGIMHPGGRGEDRSFGPISVKNTIF